MRCCVTGCKNDSRHISKSQGITFHVLPLFKEEAEPSVSIQAMECVLDIFIFYYIKKKFQEYTILTLPTQYILDNLIFPNEQSLRTAWLKALDKDNWEPKERSAVCSDHFHCDDLYETKNGLRKVKFGAVPLILQDSSNSMYGEMPALKVCRICLVSCHEKTFSLRINTYKEAYEDLTGFTVEDEEKLPQKLCPECAARLLTHSHFRRRSLRAHSIMLEILKKQPFLTEESIATVNRDNNQLTSPLKEKHYEVNHHDVHIDEDEEIKQKKPIELNVEIEIKKEEQSDVVDDGDIARIEETEEEGEENDNDDDDVELNGIDTDYVSDDSAPLEQTRIRKKLKKNEVVQLRKKQVKKEPMEPKIDRRRKPFLDNDPNEVLFTITHLTVAEQMAEIEKRQESANYKNAVYRCTKCYKGYLDEEAYKGHMTRHTNRCGDYKCDICKTHFRNQHALRKHITAHHTQRFSCNQCPYTTTHRQSARLHERWHKGTKYRCPHCQDEFVKFTTYMGHIRIKHPSDFVCELCGFSFVSAKGIELHKKLKHRLDDGLVPDDGPYCEQCNVRFISLEAHKRHLNVSARHITPDSGKGREPNKPKPKRVRKPNETKEKSTREKNGEADRNEGEFRKPEEPIPCEQCGVQLEDSRAYHSHFRRMHPDKNRTNYPSMKTPCMCELCGRIFQSHALLKDHRWVHTGERPFKCDLCEKSFRMKQRLVSHRRVHAHARAFYACELCGKNFSTQSNRQRHMFIHTGLKPFKCEMCGKCFKHASEKRTHVNYVHLKKPWPKRSRGKRRQCPVLASSMNIAANGLDIEPEPPVWPTCDNKHIPIDINTIIEDRHMYYNLRM